MRRSRRSSASRRRSARKPRRCNRRTAKRSDLSGTGRDALVDTCGTGGDTSGTFNISTATALTIAGAGVRVAKHGNRSISSKCGSADVIEALGVKIDLPPARIAACLQETGIAFLYAPAMHSAMKYVQPVRRELQLRTVFNLLGPLTNPAQASAQVVGVYSAELVEKLAEALRELGLRRALVVHGHDGLDEITITGPSKVAEVRDGQVQHVRGRAGAVRSATRHPGRDCRWRCRRECGHHSRDSRRRALLPTRCRAAECRRCAGRRWPCRPALATPCRWLPTRSTADTRASVCSC